MTGTVLLAETQTGETGAFYGSDGEESACSAEDVGSILGLEDSLEKVTATLSSILAWRIL